MQPDLVDGELYLAPNFPAPPNTDYQGYHNYIDEMMPPVKILGFSYHQQHILDFASYTPEFASYTSDFAARIS